ncbi:Hypothetical protein NGAL_HAMBI2605_65020 [Neorhizobium galegae bv. orientalis]|nr:Hypothetical protein NGAL_HAMBI2605_65020 [Neorhizobium galegae bv. orientalis]
MKQSNFLSASPTQIAGNAVLFQPSGVHDQPFRQVLFEAV